ncbi:hypothetical protein G5C51_04500 [Streptomyces sp. A7024]|uniref:Uncharacterized protein n=1 Tax=Streptomyces coryli TaxID=1128680 RepID=A0A6G4TVM5_9ACTN|nr:hypothetical protein [Streptomyces coryli]NGN63168.1 hypothetical protein [Streptomyces coryli]
MTTTDLATLREKAAKAADLAEQAKEALLDAAVAEAMKSDEHGHLSAVAREAGITSQYLRLLIEDLHPGWLEQAAANRKARKEADKEAGRKPPPRRRRTAA